MISSSVIPSINHTEYIEFASVMDSFCLHFEFAFRILSRYFVFKPLKRTILGNGHSVLVGQPAIHRSSAVRTTDTYLLNTRNKTHGKHLLNKTPGLQVYSVQEGLLKYLK
jgi:hypothetical protein